MKKLVALLLSFAMIFSIIPANVFALEADAEPSYYIKDTYVYDFMCGEDGIYKEFFLQIVETYSDGSINENCSDFFYRNETYDFGYGDVTFTDTQDTTPWEVGNTYPVTYGDGRTFNVEVLKSPVERIEVNDCNFCVYDETLDRYDYRTTCTAYYTDGTYETFVNGFYFEYYGYGCSTDLTNEDTQGEEPWVLGETYQVTGTLAGASDTFNVTVVCAENITAEDIAHTEGAGWKSGHWDEETDTYIENTWMQYDVFPENVTITLTDGSEVSGNPDGFNESIRQYLWWDSEQSYENQWSVGAHTATIYLGNLKKDYTVVIEESPVESIEIADISLMEYTYGYFNDDFYYYEPDVTATITMKDGTVITAEYLELGDFRYWIDVDTSVQYNEPWVAGNTYTVTGSLLGASDTFEVTITSSPVKSIEIEDMTFLEGTGTYRFDEDRCYYEINTVNAKVTLQDGSVITLTNSCELQIDGEWYYLELDSSQHDTPWTAGNTYTATGTLLGVTDTFQVTILPTPVQSVTFADLVLIEGIDSYSADDYEEFRFAPVLTDVVLKDGTRPEMQDGGIIYEDEHYWTSDNAWDAQQEQEWKPGGTYQVTGYLLGVKGTFNVTIVEDPIRDIELVKAPDQRECLVGAYPNMKGATIRIHYTDNTYEDIIFSDDFTAGYARSFYSKKLDRSTDLVGVAAFETAGDQMAEFEVFGHTCKIPFAVKENKMQKLILTENADKSITVSVLNSDNTGFDMKLLDMCFVWAEDENQFYGGVFTEIGLFECVIEADENSFTLALLTGGESVAVSNTIGASDWFYMMCYMQDHPLYYLADLEIAAKNYKGTITADNIDTVIEVAGSLEWLFYSGNGTEDAEGRYYEIVSGAELRDAVKKYFAVENVDLSLSQYYDARTDTYKHYDFILGRGQVMTSTPDQVSYKNGSWSINSTVDMYNGSILTLKMNLDAEGRIKDYSIGDGSIFSDVDNTSWQYSAAEYALEHNLMAGKGTDTYGRVNFDPNSPITREEFVQVLYNAEGKPPVSSTKDFPDVDDSGWYKNAVLWAFEAGIASGLGDGSFGVGRNITRQDLAVMLYKYAKMKGYDLTATAGKIDQYADGSRVSGYAQTAMNWAVTKGVLSGKGDANKPLSTFKLDPAGTATRAECAAMLRNFMTAFNP